MPPSKLLLLLIAGAGALCAQVRFEDIKNSPSENWLLYAGDYAAQRHSPLDEINRDNVDSLVAKWGLPRRGREPPLLDTAGF